MLGTYGNFTQPVADTALELGVIGGHLAGYLQSESELDLWGRISSNQSLQQLLEQ